MLTLAAVNALYPGDATPLFAYPLIVLMTLAALWVFRRDYAELREPVVASAGELAVAAGAGLLVLAIWVGIDTPLLRFSDARGYTPVGAGGEILWGWVALRIAGSALAVPVMEELFWRSFVMRWLDARDFLTVSPMAVTLRSLVFAALAFALEHAEYFAGFVAGLVYAALYRRSGRLWPAIVSHGVTNLGLGLWVVGTREWNYW